jgi:hypothetical protein
MAGTEDANAITFGIGLRKKSSIRVSDGLRRKGTVNLKGKSGAEVKRRSSSYGNTFASLASATEPAVSMLSDELESFGDDDLDGIEDDIFDQEDVIEEGDDRCVAVFLSFSLFV